MERIYQPILVIIKDSNHEYKVRLIKPIVQYVGLADETRYRYLH